eukprot:Hpha_TRINITY_DN16702_c0_g2::TRINITY_DN16702_c0_g2_i1::g.76521::m.76521
MFCHQCGEKLAPFADYCRKCGAAAGECVNNDSRNQAITAWAAAGQVGELAVEAAPACGPLAGLEYLVGARIWRRRETRGLWLLWVGAFIMLMGCGVITVLLTVVKVTGPGYAAGPLVILFGVGVASSSIQIRLVFDDSTRELRRELSPTFCRPFRGTCGSRRTIKYEDLADVFVMQQDGYLVVVGVLGGEYGMEPLQLAFADQEKAAMDLVQAWKIFVRERKDTPSYSTTTLPDSPDKPHA